MTLKCTQEEYDMLIAPTVYGKQHPRKRSDEDRAKEIALAAAQQKLDKANDLHEIEIEIAELKARNLALQVEARELEVEKKRLINDALIAKHSKIPESEKINVIGVISVFVGLATTVYLLSITGV